MERCCVDLLGAVAGSRLLILRYHVIIMGNKGARAKPFVGVEYTDELGLSELDSSDHTLAQTLRNVRDKRGALFMVETCRYLVESWDLEADALSAQTAKTKHLVARLLG